MGEWYVEKKCQCLVQISLHICLSKTFFSPPTLQIPFDWIITAGAYVDFGIVLILITEHYDMFPVDPSIGFAV